MNMEQLEYVVEVAKTGSLSKAAQRYYVSLSAVSQAISILEAELGLVIFTRSRGKGAMPTPEGKVIISKAQEILSKVEELRAEATAYSSIVNGELRIATIPGPMHLLIHGVSTFKKEFPKVKIQLFEKGPHEILQGLDQNQLDIGLLVLSEDVIRQDSQFLFQRMFEGKIVVGVSKYSPLALEKKILPEQLAAQTLILYEDDQIRAHIQSLEASYGQFDILFPSNNVQAIQNAVLSGIGVTVGLDYSFSKHVSTGSQDIIAIELDRPDEKPIYFGWAMRKGKQSSPIAKKFIQRVGLD
ncbi:DNA-binding transcriptional LysR family regulator [Brevibacillus nitrificans]|nr:DNA-binding transcriptional LysR family regulator [Brevibacillus nitrificans]